MSRIDSLLKHGANVNIQDCVGNSPLMMALEGGWDGGAFAESRRSVVCRLLAAGADLHHANKFGDNALSTAAAFVCQYSAEDTPDACQFLIGLDDHVLSKQGLQAVVAASKANKKNTVRWLVQTLSERQPGILLDTTTNGTGAIAVVSSE